MNSCNVNPKFIIAIGGGTALAGFILCSYCISFIPFFFAYGLLTGIGQGSTYMVSLICGWSYFPEKKGLVSGIILAALGIASSIYTPIMNLMVNPEGKSPTIDSGQEGLKYYSDDIANRVPAMWRNMCFIFGAELLIAFLCVTKAPS